MAVPVMADMVMAVPVMADMVMAVPVMADMVMAVPVRVTRVSTSNTSFVLDVPQQTLFDTIGELLWSSPIFFFEPCQRFTNSCARSGRTFGLRSLSSQPFDKG
jgi:hypothetical protein